MSALGQDGTTYTSGYGRRPSATDVEGFDRGTGTGEPNDQVAYNLRLMKRADDGFNIRDLDDFLFTLHAPDAFVHQIGSPETRGHEPHRADMAMWTGASPDMRVHNDPYDVQFGQGEWTVALGKLSGTFTQPLTLPDGTVVEPTGKAFTTFFTTIARWQNNQLADEYVLFDPQDLSWPRRWASNAVPSPSEHGSPTSTTPLRLARRVGLRTASRAGPRPGPFEAGLMAEADE